MNGSMLESEERECSRARIPRDANRPTFPKSVEHKKPNFPATLAATLDVSTFCSSIASMVWVSPATRLGLALTEKKGHWPAWWCQRLLPESLHKGEGL